jgi:site-specific DNA recombinase
MNNMRVALYPRVSGHEQEDNYSIPEQIERMKKYCEARDWMVYKIYTDSGFSGANLERPGLQQLIKDAENKKIDMVLVYKLDRLSRSQKDTLYLIEDVFDKHGVAFSSMTENFDTSTPFGKAILGVLAVFAQLEREKIKERTMDGKDARAKEGLWHGSSQVPTGYDYVDGKLIVNEYEAMQIREAADLFLKRTPVRAIARTLNEKGYMRKGFDWQPKNVTSILTNPVIVGKIKHRDKLYDGQHKAIIDEESYKKICEIDAERKAKWLPIHKSGQKSLLGGMLFCKHCGGRYARQGNGGGLYYYSCYSRCKAVTRMIKDPNCMNKNYTTPELDEAIVSQIKKLALDPMHMKEMQDTRPVNDASEKIKAINGEIEKIDAQISKMMDLYALGHFDLDVINTKVADLNGSKIKLQKELESLNGADDENDSLTAEQVKSIADLWDDDLTLEQKRSIVLSLIYYIEIDNDDILIHWKF